MITKVFVIFLVIALLSSSLPVAYASDDSDDRRGRGHKDDDRKADKREEDEEDCRVPVGSILRITASGDARRDNGKGRDGGRRSEDARLSMILQVTKVSEGGMKVDVVEGTIRIGSTTYTLGSGKGEINAESEKIQIGADLVSSHMKLRLHGEVDDCFEDGKAEVEFERSQSKVTGRNGWFLDLEGDLSIVSVGPAPLPAGRTRLSISKSVNATQEVGGGTLKYLIRVENREDDEARKVNVTDNLPQDANLIASNTTIALAQGKNLKFELGKIDPKKSRTIELTVRIRDLAVDMSRLRNNVSVSWVNEDGSIGGPVTSTVLTTVIAPVIKLSKTVNATSANPGRRLLYSISVNNSGHSTANVNLNDTLPANVTLVSTSLSPSIVSGRSHIWNFNLAPGGALKISVVVAVDVGIMNQVLLNKADLRYRNAKGILFPTERSEASTNVVTSIPQTTLLAISKKVNATSALGGAGLTYLISYANKGSNSALAVNITDNLPPQVTLVSTNGTIVSMVGNTVKFSFGTVPPGRNASIVIRVRVAELAADNLVLRNNATIDWRNLDGSSRSERATAQTVVRAPVLSLSKTVNATVAVVGSHLLYTVKVNNTGHADAILLLNDTLPFNTSLRSFSFVGPSSSLTISGNSLLWNFSLAPNQTATITILVRVEAGATSPLANNVSVNYRNQLGVTFPRISARAETTLG